MLRFIYRLILVLAVAGAVQSARAFSMLGQFDTWQVARIGYALPGDLGGPMNLGEEYRWNINTVIYGFDESYLNYFGQRGVDEVEKAFAILNALPSVSKLSSNLREYPTDTTRANQRASAVGLLDIKSITLGILLEQLGLASPERYVWTLRARAVISGTTFYSVIKRNFDPVTREPSSYVNDVLYTYTIFDGLLPGPFADAVEIPVDPLAIGYTAVVSSADGLWGSSLFAGNFYTGLTRDDVGGLRELYRKNNYNTETLVPGTQAGFGSPWTPVTQASTNVVDAALRPGVDKILFKRGKYDSILGSFIASTNSYKDTYVVNSRLQKQGVSRLLAQPDILIEAADLGVVQEVPITLARSISFQDNDAINGVANLAGPGQINPTLTISYSKVGPWLDNNDSSGQFLTEAGALRVIGWGAFDGTTNEPVVFPSGTSIEDIEAQVLGGGN